jgi:hypothetical protein
MPNLDSRIPNPCLRDHVTIGLLCLAPLVAGAVLQVDGSNVVLPLGDVALPTVCWSRRWFDVSCPGCGLTRGLVSVMHGDLAGAWNYNSAVFAAIAALIYQVIFRTLQIQRIRTAREPLRSSAGMGLFWITLGAMLVQWTLRR